MNDTLFIVGNQAVRLIKLTFNIILSFPSLSSFKRMLKMVEKKNSDEGELINQTAWFTKLVNI